MKAAEVVKWFEEIQAAMPATMGGRSYPPAEEIKWRTDVSSALTTAFPRGHQILKEWDALLARVNAPRPRHDVLEVEHRLGEEILGLFQSALAQVRAGRVTGLIDSVLAGAEDEVLEQAVALLNGSYLAAAAVLAGGALEVHLRHLCEKNAIPLPAGPGSIDKYNTAIAQARNNGTTVYDKPEQSMVTAWGQLRNEAAHDPAQFNTSRTSDTVRHLIDNVRGFIARVS